MKNLYFPVLMSIAMSTVMSLIITMYNTGIDAQLLSRWLPSLPISFFAALPTTLLLNPYIAKASNFMIRTFHNENAVH